MPPAYFSVILFGVDPTQYFCCAFVPFIFCGDGAVPDWGWSWGTPRVLRLLHEPMVSGAAPLGERCRRQRAVSCLPK